MTIHLPQQELLPAETIKAVGRLELLARTPKEGFVTGKHRSPNKGFSVEFAEHRAYAPGDDTRNIDWRVLGRTDRLYVKEFVEETNMRATLLVDCSGSMGYAGNEATLSARGTHLSKFDFARRMAAALSYILINQQDAVGTVLFDSAVRTQLPARARPSQLKTILDLLGGATPGGDTGLADVFHEIAERIPRRGLVAIFSDLFDDPGRLVNSLHHFRHRRHEVILFHILAEEELTFPFASFAEFADLEVPGNALPLDPRTIRAEYLAQMREFIHIVELECGRLSIDYVPVNTKRPDALVLAEYLKSRHK